MEIKDIQRLIDFVSKSDLDEINIETAELKLHIKRNAGTTVVQTASLTPVATSISAAPVSIALAQPEVPTAAAQVEKEDAVAANGKLIEVKSPMIGTFYRASGPDKPNFKEVGDTIAVGEVICIVEAMKLFNEIESEVKGKIVKILVEDASPIEYDQALFLVDPA